MFHGLEGVSSVRPVDMGMTYPHTSHRNGPIMTTERPAHLPNPTGLASLPDFTPEAPLRILMSGCLFGISCGYDGTTCGHYPAIAHLLMLQNVRTSHYCPEDHAFGTPRKVSNIYGGDGFDVLDGRARVLTDDGEDWTEGTIRGAEAMVEVARKADAHCAILLDISAACGSQVIYDGPRDRGNYRKGPGVAAALLIRSGFPVISQRDYRTLGLLFRKLGIEPPAMPEIDHHETEWYIEYFGR